MNMNIKSKEGIADFIEANLKELGGDAYGVDYVAEKLWEWHESELKTLRLGVVAEQSEQLVCCHKYQDNVCDNRGVRKCVICGQFPPF